MVIRFVFLAFFSAFLANACGLVSKTSKASNQDRFTCSKLSNYLDTAKSKMVSRTMGDAATSSSTPNSANVEETNRQEIDVDESDVLKAGEHHIFFQRLYSVVVVDRDRNIELGAISLDNVSSAQMYVHNSTLVLLTNDQSNTSVRFYGLKAGKMPKLKKTMVIQGYLGDSRRIGNSLVVLAMSGISEDAKVTSEGLLMRSNSEVEEIEPISCDSVLVPSPSVEPSYLKSIYTVDLEDLDASPNSISLFGGWGQTYVTAKNIFFAEGKMREGNQLDAWGYGVDTVITRLDFDPSEKNYTLAGVGEVEGYVRSEWALKASLANDVLFVTTTVAATSEHNMFALALNDGVLEPISQVKEFGRNEDIYAVRYVGEMAYVVTFFRVDPLYAIDLSNPQDLRIVGELKVPGFSTYLHPLSNKRLFGLGYDADANQSIVGGVQASMFDVSNPTDIRRTSNMVHGAAYTYSEATFNHHAFYYDQESEVLGFPLMEVSDEDTKPNSISDLNLVFSGAVFYGVDGSKLKEELRVSHKDMIPEHCFDGIPSEGGNFRYLMSMDIQRILRLGKKIYTSSPFGLKVRDIDLSGEEQSLLFKDSDRTCENYIKLQYGWCRTMVE